MSVKVNLLPREIDESKAARRTQTWSAVGVLVVVALLGFLYMAKLGEIRQAEEDREVAQAEVARLQAEVAQLSQYRQLADEFEARNALLASAMEQEISFARTLNDLSLAFPASSSLRSFQLTAGTTEVAEGEISFGESMGTGVFEGYSVERVAPGVETVILEFDKVSAFFNSFISTADLEEIGTTDVTAFSGNVQLNHESLTRRYVDGLPEEINR